MKTDMKETQKKNIYKKEKMGYSNGKSNGHDDHLKSGF